MTFYSLHISIILNRDQLCVKYAKNGRLYCLDNQYVTFKVIPSVLQKAYFGLKSKPHLHYKCSTFTR